MKHHSQQLLKRLDGIWIYGVYLAFYGFIVSVLYQKAGSFGCFDDCFNYMGGWFLLKGRVLYEQIFFNHQPLAAYLSAIIQTVLNPASIYQLVLYHRFFVYGFALVFGILLLRRFGIKALLFLLLYESTKYYFFGDRFLAEGLIVYPLVYLLGLVLLGLQKVRFTSMDILIGTISMWFVFWMREPYIPLVIFLYVFFLFLTRSNKARIVSLLLLGLASGFFFLLFPLSDYYFSVVTVNTSFHLKQPVTARILYESFFYPVVIFISGRDTQLRYFEMVLSGVFVATVLFTIRQKKNLLLLLTIFFTLGLANLRPTPPGTQYYEAFHMLSWYALFLFSISFLMFQLKKIISRWLFGGGVVILLLSLSLLLFNRGSYIREKTDSQGLFYEGYNQYYTAGEIVKQLSDPESTLFLDGWNDLIYWQADRSSSYQYGWYTSVMSGFPRYTTARTELLDNNPPDFFYGACREWPFSKVSKAFLAQYTQVFYQQKPSCLYIKQEIISSLHPSGLLEMEKLGYTIAK